jgi:hypothetical protein
MNQTNCLGFSDPQFNSPSGLDVRVYARLDDDTLVHIKEVQVVSVKEQYNGGFIDLITLLHDGDTVAHLLKNHGIKDLVIESKDEYGTILKTEFLGLTFQQRSWGVSVDDLITEIKTLFTCKTCIPWTKQ